jgi:hypothetical protein
MDDGSFVPLPSLAGPALSSEDALPMHLSIGPLTVILPSIRPFKDPLAVLAIFLVKPCIASPIRPNI